MKERITYFIFMIGYYLLFSISVILPGCVIFYNLTDSLPLCIFLSLINGLTLMRIPIIGVVIQIIGAIIAYTDYSIPLGIILTIFPTYSIFRAIILSMPIFEHKSKPNHSTYKPKPNRSAYYALPPEQIPLVKKYEKQWKTFFPDWTSVQKEAFLILSYPDIHKKDMIYLSTDRYLRCDLQFLSIILSTYRVHSSRNSDTGEVLPDDTFMYNLLELVVKDIEISTNHFLTRSDLLDLFQQRYTVFWKILCEKHSLPAFIEEAEYLFSSDYMDKGFSDFTESSPLPLLNVYAQQKISYETNGYFTLFSEIIAKLV